ncbi:MAG: hypothetical protein AB1796_11765 [Bacillota bacterium]
MKKEKAKVMEEERLFDSDYYFGCGGAWDDWDIIENPEDKKKKVIDQSTGDA